MLPAITFAIGLLIGGAITYYTYSSNNNDNDGEGVDLNEKLISNAKAITMINSFQADHNQTDSVDAVSGHIPLDILLGYVAQMNTLSKDNTGKEISGLEVYLAKYGKNIEEGHLALPNQKTFLIYPTYLNDGKHKPFDPMLSQGDNIIEIENLRNSTTGMNSTQSESRVALNRSNMVPPRW